MQFSYHTPYQPETPISAQGPKARVLKWESRADVESRVDKGMI